MFVGCGTGDEVQVLVIQVRNPERVLPVLERGPGREYLGCVALQRGDPGLDRVLSQLHLMEAATLAPLIDTDHGVGFRDTTFRELVDFIAELPW